MIFPLIPLPFYLLFPYYDILVKKRSLHRNGMAANPKTRLGVTTLGKRLLVIIYLYVMTNAKVVKVTSHYPV